MPGSRDIGGVSRSDAQTLASLSLTEEQLSSPSGLQSMIYHYRDTGILAFAGSNDMSDMMTNIRQGRGLPARQYQEAVSLAAHLLSQSVCPWLFVGHSLGGGLASFCAVVLQQPAVIFNAAGLAENHPPGSRRVPAAINPLRSDAAAAKVTDNAAWMRKPVTAKNSVQST